MAAETVEVFERHRARVFGLAYRVLGSATEAEDIVQEAFLRWHNTEPGSIEVPSAWLAKVATNLCLNRLDSAHSRRERYVGTWLPEPVLTPDSCRQLHRRAKKRLADAEMARSSADPPDHRALVEQFLVAARSGDLAGLERILAADVGSVVDGGGMPGVARRPVRGVAKVARYLAATASRSVEGVAVSIEEVNGAPAVLAWFGTTLAGVLVPEIADERIVAVRIVAAPDKLRFLGDQAARLSHSPEVSGSQ